MSRLDNPCEICKFFSRFDRWCRVFGRRERPDRTGCVHWEADEKRIEQQRKAELEKMLDGIKSGDIDPQQGNVLEKIGLMMGGWAVLRSYNPHTHEFEIEIMNMPWETERNSLGKFTSQPEEPQP